jgi:multidrug efflux pump subunit AcrB
MIALFTRHATAANILMVLLIGLGVAALPTLQRDSFPEVPPSDVEVRIAYPGAAPADVEAGICLVAEDPIRSVENLAELICQARDNMAVLTAEIVEGADMTRFAADVKAAVDGVTSYPARADAPVTRIVERVSNVASIAVTGPDDPKVLFAYADQLAEFLKADGMISQATVGGFSDREIIIEISATALQRYGLTISAVNAALTRNSLDVPAGTLEGRTGDALIRFAGERKTAAELATIPLLGSELGSEVLLGDVAEITNRFADDFDATFFNGRRAAIVSVTKTSAQDALRVMSAIESRLAIARAQAPAGIDLAISQDSTSNITERLRIITTNGLQGLILVLIVMGLFFGLRFSFWVALTLPVSFLGTIFAMQLMGLTINMITMVALLVAIGLLMDDSIVISENIVRRRLAGDPPMQAALEGVAQVGPGVLASFLTTVMIVGPLGLMAGQIGAVLKFLPVVLVITLVVSLVEAFFVLPNHLAHALKGDMRPNRVNRWMNGVFDALRDKAIVPLARYALRFRYFTLGLVGCLFLLSLAPVTGGLIKFQSFPTLESDTVEARLLLPQGAPLAQTEARVQRVVAALEQINAAETPNQPDGQPLVQSVTVSYGTNADARAESGAHLATVSAKLLPAGIRTTTLTQIVNDWRRKTGPMPDMASLRFTDKDRGVGGKPIDVRLQGPDLEVLEQTARQMRSFLRAFQGVRDVAYDLRPGKPEYVVSLRPAAASALGVTAQSIATELRASFRGDTSLEVQDNLGSLDIVVRLDLSDRNAASDIGNIRVAGTGGALVPLSAVADITLTRGYGSIMRIDGMRTVSVTGSINADIANSRELMAALRADFLPELAERHPEINVVVVGEAKDTATTGASLMRNLAMGFIGVWLILAFQFRSFIQPIAVFVAIPLGVIGMMWGHLALGMQLSLPSFVGLATLAGVVVNNSILLVEFIKRHFENGDDLLEAGVLAVRDRFRAIFLTSVTTVVGLGPLLFEQSTQAQFLRPIVASLAFGLTGATFLALFITPAAYLVLHDLRLVRRRPAIDNA